MLISELAKTTGLTIDTIRYYEKEGLLNAMHMVRGSNNYRHYTQAAVDRLLLIKRGQMIGFTLAEMRQWIGDWEDGLISLDQKEAFFAQKMAQIDAHIAELQQMKVYLYEKLDMLRAEKAEQQAVIT